MMLGVLPAVLFWLSLLPGLTGEKPVSENTEVLVHLEIIPDSVNVIKATLRVKKGTPARDLMNRLFQMDYADWRKTFVTGIAGFHADGRRRQFWALSVDGKPSQVGIAEITINQPVHIRWQIQTY